MERGIKIGFKEEKETGILYPKNKKTEIHVRLSIIFHPSHSIQSFSSQYSINLFNLKEIWSKV
jgi:hypothetical protein